MIRRDIATRTGADGRPLAVFRFAPNSRELRYATTTFGWSFFQCSGTEKNKTTASKAEMPKTKGANSINMAHPGVRSSAWSSAPCFPCPPVDVHGNLDRLG